MKKQNKHVRNGSPSQRSIEKSFEIVVYSHTGLQKIIAKLIGKASVPGFVMIQCVDTNVEYCVSRQRIPKNELQKITIGRPLRSPDKEK